MLMSCVHAVSPEPLQDKYAINLSEALWQNHAAPVLGSCASITQAALTRKEACLRQQWARSRPKQSRLWRS